MAVRRSACGPAKCPQPPLSQAEERSPYCQDWVSLLTTEAAGKLLIALEGCLFFLKSKCSGVVWFNADTEQVDIRFPDFVSSLPKENNYGFLAKVVPTIRKVCVDGVEGCEEEVHQELAAQVLGQSDCGELMIARSPLCGDIPASNAGNVDAQVHVDYLAAPNHEDLADCVTDFRFLGTYMGDRGDANRTPCRKWSLMRRLKMRLSQWGVIAKNDPLVTSAKTIALIPVAGGDTEDPCYELRALESGAGGLPSDPSNCDTIQFKNKGTDQEGWYAVPKGMAFYPSPAPVVVLNTTGSGTIAAVLPGFPENPCGDVFAVFQTFNYFGNGPSGAATSRKVSLGAYLLAYAGFHDAVGSGEARAKVASANVNFTIQNTGSSSGLTEIKLIGYYY